MSIRLYWSPIIGDGMSLETAYRPSVADKPKQKHTAILPGEPYYTVDGDMNPDSGKPKFPHALVLVRTDDWTSFDADAGELLLVPDQLLDTIDAFRDYLTTRTVADVPQAYRDRWNSALTAIGANVADITPATPLVRIWRRLLYHLGTGFNEQGLSL